MTIPKNFGISKISHMRGEEETRYEGREGSSSSSRGKWDTSMQQVGNWGTQDVCIAHIFTCYVDQQQVRRSQCNCQASGISVACNWSSCDPASTVHHANQQSSLLSFTYLAQARSIWHQADSISPFFLNAPHTFSPRASCPLSSTVPTTQWPCCLPPVSTCCTYRPPRSRCCRRRSSGQQHSCGRKHWSWSGHCCALAFLRHLSRPSAPITSKFG